MSILLQLGSNKGDRIKLLKQAVNFISSLGSIEKEGTIYETAAWGKTDQKDDKSQIIINSIEVVEQVKMVMINLSAEEVSNPSVQNKLKSILQEQSGDKNKAKVPIIGIINSIKERIFIRFGENFWVQNEENTVEALKNAGFNAYSQFVKQS